MPRGRRASNRNAKAGEASPGLSRRAGRELNSGGLGVSKCNARPCQKDTYPGEQGGKHPVPRNRADFPANARIGHPRAFTDPASVSACVDAKHLWAAG